MINIPSELIKAGNIANEAIQLGFSIIKTRGLVTKSEVDREIEAFIRDSRCLPSLKGYKPPFSDKTYQWATCISQNLEVVHAPPTNQVLKAEKDLITIDLVVKCGEWHADSARTKSFNPAYFNLVTSGMEVLNAAIKSIKPESLIRDYGDIVEKESWVRGLHPIRQLSGHGINPGIHEEPSVKNFYDKDDLNRFEIGKTYACEPILGRGIAPSNLEHEGDWVIKYPVISVHNEHTIFITENRVVNLTG